MDGTWSRENLAFQGATTLDRQGFRSMAMEDRKTGAIVSLTEYIDVAFPGSDPQGQLMRRHMRRMDSAMCKYLWEDVPYIWLRRTLQFISVPLCLARMAWSTLQSFWESHHMRRAERTG